MDSPNLFKEYDKIFKQEEDSSKEKKKKQKTYSYSPFALQDAIGEKNVKNIWIEYQKIILKGVEEEEIIYKIIAKIRDMLAINLGASAEDLGIKDYPYNKSRRDLKNWNVEDLKNFYTKLISVYHQSRMPNGESLEIALEKAILNL